MSETTYSKKNSEYFNKNPNWHIEDSAWKALQIVKMMKRNDLHPSSMVEIGCGAGEIINQLHQALKNERIAFNGYEISPDAFRMCQDRIKPGINFYNEDLLEKNVFFDLLLMIDVFEHVEDYIGFIRKSAKKATYKIYHIPLDISISSVLRNMPLNARKKVGHLHYFMKDTALSTLTDTGQEIIDYFYTPGAVALTKNASYGLRTRLLNGPRRLFFKMDPDFTVKLFGGYSLMVLTK